MMVFSGSLPLGTPIVGRPSGWGCGRPLGYEGPSLKKYGSHQKRAHAQQQNLGGAPTTASCREGTFSYRQQQTSTGRCMLLPDASKPMHLQGKTAGPFAASTLARAITAQAQGLYRWKAQAHRGQLQQLVQLNMSLNCTSVILSWLARHASL